MPRSQYNEECFFIAGLIILNDAVGRSEGIITVSIHMTSCGKKCKRAAQTFFPRNDYVPLLKMYPKKSLPPT